MDAGFPRLPSYMLGPERVKENPVIHSPPYKQPPKEATSLPMEKAINLMVLNLPL
jgi:hypothetical protein